MEVIPVWERDKINKILSDSANCHVGNKAGYCVDSSGVSGGWWCFFRSGSGNVSEVLGREGSWSRPGELSGKCAVGMQPVDRFQSCFRHGTPSAHMRAQTWVWERVKSWGWLWLWLESLGDIVYWAGRDREGTGVGFLQGAVGFGGEEWVDGKVNNFVLNRTEIIC